MTQDEIVALKQAVDTDDLDRVKALMSKAPQLHGAPLGYGKNGPLTWVAECRVPWQAPSSARLRMAQWMIDNGSDVHQGGDGPLSRAALQGYRIPMMELLVSNGADVNAQWNGNFPILFSPCEAVDPDSLKWLLEHGADPNVPGQKDTALDYLLGTYGRSPKLTSCIEILLAYGGRTRYNQPGVLDILRGKMPGADLVRVHYDGLDFGSTGARRLLLNGGTLLHLAAEFGLTEIANFLLDKGADVNAKGQHGQSPIFHSATQFGDYGLEVTKLLIERGADLQMKALVPGHYELPDEFVNVTPLEYSERFPGSQLPSPRTIALLRRHAFVI